MISLHQLLGAYLLYPSYFGEEGGDISIDIHLQKKKWDKGDLTERQTVRTVSFMFVYREIERAKQVITYY